MSMPVFDNEWYAKMIDRYYAHTEGDDINVAIDCHGSNIFAAACVIAQAIDGLSDAIKRLSKKDADD